MRQFHIVAIFAFLILSCKSNNTKGELTGAPGQKWFSEKPYGMELIPSGSFVMGKSIENVVNSLNAPTKSVTVKAFYMDDTEITNAEYRQYVNWVKDSIVRYRLAILADDLGLGPEDEGIGNYAFKEADTTNMTPYQKYRFYNTLEDPDNPYAGYSLNREIDIIWETDDYPDEYYSEVMDQLYLSEDENYNGQRSFKVKYFK